MAADVVTVILEGRPIGEVERLGHGALRLHFDDAYCTNPNATLLSVSMPPSLPTLSWWVWERTGLVDEWTEPERGIGQSKIADLGAVISAAAAARSGSISAGSAGSPASAVARLRIAFPTSF